MALSGVREALLFDPISVCFTLLFLGLVSTEEKVKQEWLFFPCLGKAVFLCCNAKGVVESNMVMTSWDPEVTGLD